jgi:hypothetical protein
MLPAPEGDPLQMSRPDRSRISAWRHPGGMPLIRSVPFAAGTIRIPAVAAKTVCCARIAFFEGQMLNIPETSTGVFGAYGALTLILHESEIVGILSSPSVMNVSGIVHAYRPEFPL